MKAQNGSYGLLLGKLTAGICAVVLANFVFNKMNKTAKAEGGELEAFLDYAQGETGKAEIPLTRQERAALARLEAAAV